MLSARPHSGCALVVQRCADLCNGSHSFLRPGLRVAFLPNPIRGPFAFSHTPTTSPNLLPDDRPCTVPALFNLPYPQSRLLVRSSHRRLVNEGIIRAAANAVSAWRPERAAWKPSWKLSKCRITEVVSSLLPALDKAPSPGPRIEYSP